VKISIIGSGNIASFFGQRLKEKGFDIVEVFSTNSTSGKKLALDLEAQFVEDHKHISAQVVLLAIPDDALDFYSTATFKDKKTIIFSGTKTIKDLDISSNLACIWPIYSINKEQLPTDTNIPLLLEANNEEMSELATQLAKSVSTNYFFAQADEKMQYHLAAVLVNNFGNHLASLTQELLKLKGLKFELMHPIISNTAEKILSNSPEKLQTGPALRKDVKTMESHLNTLENSSILKQLYELFSKSIQDFHSNE